MKAGMSSGALRPPAEEEGSDVLHNEKKRCGRAITDPSLAVSHHLDDTIVDYSL